MKTVRLKAIQFSVLAIPFLFFSSPTTRAQVVNDGATVTLNHVTNTISGSITVGTNGPFTLLILTNGTLLTNSGNGTIGLNAGANSNTVKVTSGNTRWLMSQDLSVGSIGSFNHLLITNGGMVQNGFGALGIDPASSRQPGGRYQCGIGLEQSKRPVCGLCRARK